MSDFFKKFLLEDSRKFSDSGRYVALAAFGKHPGWDDHIGPLPGRITVADLGLETESLNLATTVFYVNGIGGQIDSGAWEKLDSTQQLSFFKHVFVWQRSGQILIGRLWSSSDGKGRKLYPMVVCLHFIGVTLGGALKLGLAALAELEEGCVTTKSAEEVCGLLGRQRIALRKAIQTIDSSGEYAPVMPEALHKILPPAGDARREGFLRVLYQMQSQLGAFAVGTPKTRVRPSPIRAQQIRVPAAGESVEKVLLFWTRFFLAHIEASAPLLLTMPLEEGWVDVTVGEPESHEFFCLRASPKAVPLVSEVPYTMDDAFRAKAEGFLQGFERGETSAVDLEPVAVAAPTGNASVPAKSNWRKWLGVGVVLIIGAVAVMMFLPKDENQQARFNLLDSKPKVEKPVVITEIAGSALPVPDITNAEAVRLAKEKKDSEDMAAAAKLKAEAEAAAKEKERQMAETARIEKEKEAARQTELQEHQRQEAGAAAKKKADEEAQAKIQLAVVTVANATDPTPATTSAKFRIPDRLEMTNSIEMVLVQLPSKIWAGKYEVTQAEYLKVMKNNPSKSRNDRQPVEWVTRDDAVEFCRRLTEMEHSKLPAGKYTLPTEAQWKELRADQKFEEIPGGVMGRTGPSVVGQSGSSNKFGLYDVLGNVWEWCLDAPEDRQLKGGAFNSAKYEQPAPLGGKGSNCGFRCVVAAP